MFTIKTVETPDRILVTGRGDGGFAFFGFLFVFAGWIWIIWGNFFSHWIVIVITVFLGLVTLFFFVRLNKVISEVDLNMREIL